MSNKNRNFKKLLAAVCGVASTLGGGAASAKNSNVKSAAPAQKNTGLIESKPLQVGLISLIGTGLVAGGIFGGKYVYNKYHDQQNPPPGDQDPDKEKDPKKEENPEEKGPKKEDLFAFDKIKVAGFQSKRAFSKEFDRDSNFLTEIMKYVNKNTISENSIAAFDSKDKSNTIYVIDAPEDSDIRKALVNSMSSKKLSTSVPNVLVFSVTDGSFYGVWVSKPNITKFESNVIEIK